GAGEMTTHDGRNAGAGGAAGLLGQLKRTTVEADHIVLTDDAIGLLTQDLVEIDRAERDEGGVRVSRGPREGRVVVGDEARAQVAIRRLEGADIGQAQLVHEPVLQRAVEPFPPAARLRGVGPDVFDAEAGEGAADVREVVAIDGPPGLRRVEGPARAT